MKYLTVLKILLVTIILYLGISLGLDLTLYAQTGDTTIAAAGDIATASTGGKHALTAAVVGSINPNAVLVLGDNQYPDGLLADYNNFFNGTWGKYKSKMHPVPGNHEYHVLNAQGYFDYFNGVGVNTGMAGERGKGYYSYNLGSWHLIALNSEAMSSTQNAWLENDLNNTTAACVLAYWHSPRWSSGTHGSNAKTAPFVDALYRHKADVILTGHDHTYERFGPQNPQGAEDTTSGIREFVAGMGGAGLYAFTTIAANSQFRNNTQWGVLKMSLRTGNYDWTFYGTGNQVLDSGSSNCVGGGSGILPTVPRVANSPTTAISIPPGGKPGDGNNDNKVDGLDYVLWLNHFNQQVFGPTLGDFNSDNKVDGLDYVIWLNNFGR